MVLSYIKRFLRLYAGLFLCAVSILLAIQGGVGVTPWDVFHMGIQNITGISYGTVNILVGLCILTTSIVLGEPIGFGTLCNTLSVGYMVDFLKRLNWVPAAPNAFVGCGMMVLSLFVLAMGSFLYIGAGMGCGPRDSMMTAFSKRLTRVPVGLIRGGHPHHRLWPVPLQCAHHPPRVGAGHSPPASGQDRSGRCRLRQVTSPAILLKRPCPGVSARSGVSVFLQPAWRPPSELPLSLRRKRSPPRAQHAAAAHIKRSRHIPGPWRIEWNCRPSGITSGPGSFYSLSAEMVM